MLAKLLTRSLGEPELIDDHYLQRWTLAAFRNGAGAYLQRFVGSDCNRDLHDHPKRFVSIGLWGSYIEETPAPAGSRGRRTFRAPWVRTFPAEHIHRILLPEGGGECWTLVIVLPATQEWGFYTRGGWIRWTDYTAARRNRLNRDC